MMRWDSTGLRRRAAAWITGAGLTVAAAPVPAQPDVAPDGQGGVQAPPATRASILNDARERAEQIALDASRSDKAQERAAALEAAQAAPDRALPMAQLALSDENPGVRFAALVTIGLLQLDGLGPAAMDLFDDDNVSVRGAAVFAAHRCGEDVDEALALLPQMLASSDSGTRGNAAMLLGMLGDPGAIPMLQEMAYQPTPRVSHEERAWLQLQFAEAILRLDPDHLQMLEVLHSSVHSTIDDLRILALRIAGEVGDQSLVQGLDGVIDSDDPIQVRIAAARSSAQLGHDDGRALLHRGAGYSAQQVLGEARAYVRANGGRNSREAELMRQLIADPDAQAAVAADIRAQAAFGLGELRDAASARLLVGMLEDDHPIVRLAAAAAVLEALGGE